MTRQLVTSKPADLAQRQAVGESANAHAAAAAFDKYLKGKAPNTRRRQLAELAVFARFLAEAKFYSADNPDEADLYDEELDKHRARNLQTTGAAWAGMTHGLVEAFIEWQLQQGYAIGTINARLSTVKRYAGLAFRAEAIDHTEYALMKLIQGYSRKEAKHVNEDRTAEGLPTRQGAKKAQPVELTPEQARQLKAWPDRSTPQGRRDFLLMALLLDLGLRVSELVILQVGDFNLKGGTLTFYRPKVDKNQTLKLSQDVKRAIRAMQDAGEWPAVGYFLRASSKRGALAKDRFLNLRTATGRVRFIGRKCGIAHLSAHDCRHFWATNAARMGMDAFRLQEAGGWASLAMPRRYVKWAEVANEGWRWGDTMITTDAEDDD